MICLRIAQSTYLSGLAGTRSVQDSVQIENQKEPNQIRFFGSIYMIFGSVWFNF